MKSRLVAQRDLNGQNGFACCATTTYPGPTAMFEALLDFIRNSRAVNQAVQIFFFGGGEEIETSR